MERLEYFGMFIILVVVIAVLGFFAATGATGIVALFIISLIFAVLTFLIYSELSKDNDMTEQPPKNQSASNQPQTSQTQSQTNQTQFNQSQTNQTQFNQSQFIPGQTQNQVTIPNPYEKCYNSECKKWLDLHNSYRQKAGYYPLSWDPDLEKQARLYAERLHEHNQFVHGDMCSDKCTGSRGLCPGGGRKCGQNLQKAKGISITTPETSVNRWYAECKNYKKPPQTADDIRSSKDMFTHYTQVMWKDARKLGCAIAGSVSNCLYDKGNVLKTFDANVPPPGKC